MRRYPAPLIAQLEAVGNLYCSPNTLRFFDAYGGEVLHREQGLWVIVESIRDTFSNLPREYRVTRFEFSGDEVEITHLTDNYSSARQAVSAYRELSV